jgi:NAD(P)-dependent dehydrogenase (short-subunit alcohol dehydrogenase family)
MNPVYDFHGRVAVVTGAGSGIGLATAQAFAHSGAAVVLADSNEQPLRSAAAELTSAGHQALGVGCDVSDEAQVAALIEGAVDTFGRLDFAFNNAGIQAPPTDAADEPAGTFDRVNAINLRGVWACMKHEAICPGRSRRGWSPTWSPRASSTWTKPSPTSRSHASAKPARSPRPCSGSAAPARAS